MSTPYNPADGQHVVIQNGQRVTGTLSEEDAKREAQRLAKLQESAGQPVPETQRPAVKRNICG